MSETHIIDRSKDCHIIANATDKPIVLSMHHFHARSLIINLKTGDVLSHLFSDSHQSSGQRQFENSGVNQLEHNLFLEQEGEKVIFFLKTTYRSPMVNLYLDAMLKKGVNLGGEIIANIENDYKEYENYKFGEIFTEFTIDLTNPSIIKVAFNNESGIDLTQDLITEVGTDKSNLPDINEQVQLYFAYSSIGKMIANADQALAERLEESKVDLSDLTRVHGHIADSLSMHSENAFHHAYLYKKENEDYVINTLNIVKDKGLDPVVVASLCGSATQQLIRQVLDNFDEDVFYHLVSLSQKVMAFSFDLILSQDSEEMKENCRMQMSDRIVRLQGFILSRLKDFDCDKLPDHMKNLKERLALPKYLTK